MKKTILTLIVFTLAMATALATERQKVNFNSNWLLKVGDTETAALIPHDDSQWKRVTLPYAFNGDEAYRKDIVDLTDTIVWYRKHFNLHDVKDKKVFVEFEGVRQGADFYLNGKAIGMSENGVMACGFDLTPYIKEGENVIAVRCDNNWRYRSKKHNSPYQWNDRNFNANYGGIPKNVFLHITGRIYQTLPLYSDLGTTGTYIYATDYDINGHQAKVHAESEVKNESQQDQTLSLVAEVTDADGKTVATLNGDPITIKAGQTATLKAAGTISGLHFWSWGYGYLYQVKTMLKDANGTQSDAVITRTGFRKTRFGEGKIWLNDRVIMMHGYAQRTSNEWPGVGLSVPAWLSDYSNALMVESGANLVRWMHVTPWKQDVESCDRVGLIQAMPAGDAEKDVTGPRWNQRVELMRDAIIYNRNNPSILFYEGGNESISREHMLELKAIRDQYDPHGGRAIGSREMLDIDEAEYGGEMLYINKSGKHPMWAMEYCRDEGLRKYWDEQSYPYHQEGDGPLYRGKPANDYNHNMDVFAIEMVRRWEEYWKERPGGGKRSSAGGVKIIFSDTNTHHRGESNFRTSGVVDAMRLPKDAFYVHQVMWDGWVEPEYPHTHIIGHWNYDSGTRKPVYVVSNADEVELFVNGKSMGKGERSHQYLFTFKDIAFESGKIEAVASNGSRDERVTAGQPFAIRLVAMSNPEGMKADGADMALVEVEVIDKEGRRCPLDDRLIHFSFHGEATWIGGIGTRDNKAMQRADTNRDKSLLDAAATKNVSDNYVGAMTLPVECGVNRVLLRSTENAGDIQLYAWAEGVKPAALTLTTTDPEGNQLPQLSLPCRLDRGETPATPSYADRHQTVAVKSATAGCHNDNVTASYDDNELTEWKSDGKREHAWITYSLERKAAVSKITMKLTGWRSLRYPLAVYAGKKKVWEGITEPSLGYVHIDIPTPVKSDRLTIKMLGPATNKTEKGDTSELAGGKAGELDRVASAKGAVNLRIVEVDMLE